MTRRLVLALAALGAVAGGARAQDKVFSGPQAGEKLPPFKVRGVFDADAGKDVDFVARADGKPILLVFVHDANRPSIGLTRVLMNYATTRAKDGLTSGVVWLTDDVNEAETYLKRVRTAVAKDAAIGISPDGKEGPGAYGLNRNVTLTVLVGKDNKVTANFPLVQPSIQADLPKVLKAIADVAGGEVAKLEDLPEVKDMLKARPAAEADPKVPGLMRAVIQREAKPEDVEKAAKAVEEYVKDNAAARKEVGRIAKTVVEGGKLDNYGTATAQDYLRKWAKEYGAKPEDAPKKKDAEREKKQ
jgi:hypothetical protein